MVVVVWRWFVVVLMLFVCCSFRMIVNLFGGSLVIGMNVVL